MHRFFTPKYLLSGILIGFVLCCLMGYFLSMKARIAHFSRFFLAIEPQTLYYPTASELLQTVRHKVSKDKILVLIGGSSILRGVGQNPDELWSNKLQQLLGDKYQVINFASDGASFSSFGGVVFRMLREEYPKIIFVAASYQFNSEGSLDGLPPYDYLFWEAYYKHLFHPYKSEETIIQTLKKNQMATAAGLEQHLMAYLDSFFYFRNLWNWVSYRVVFTLFSDFVFQKPYYPRRTFNDEPITSNYINELRQVNRDEEHLKKYKDLITFTTTALVVDLNKKSLQINESILNSGKQGYNEVFDQIDRRKILMVQTNYNTGIINSLPKKIRTGYWFINDQFDKILASLGYNVINVGKNYTDSDFIDVDHFLPSGGNKLAKQVATAVKKIAIENRYTA